MVGEVKEAVRAAHALTRYTPGVNVMYNCVSK